MKCAAVFWLVVSLLICACAQRTLGVPILDQQSMLDDIIGVEPGIEWQQGVTAGIAGDLVWVGFSIGTGSYDYEFDLYVSADPPWQGAPHDYETAIIAPGPGTYVWDVSAGGLSFDVGDQFTIGVKSKSSTSPMVEIGYNSHTSSPDYPGGELYLNGIPYGKGDLAFTTWVEPKAIPAPGAIVICGIGVAFVDRLRRRRKL